METVHLDPANGDLVVSTGVAGRAARLGHDLRLAVDDWQGTVAFSDDEPREVRLLASLASLRVESASGGVKPLTDGDRDAIRRNALATLDVEEYPAVLFASDEVTESDGGYDVVGTLQLAGRSRPCRLHLALADAGAHWEVSAAVDIRQSDFGITPFSTMLGALRVADLVGIEFAASIGK